MRKPSSIIGFAVSPTRISAIKLSVKDFSIESQLNIALPPAIISHDSKKILDEPTLIPIIQELISRLGGFKSSDPVYLTICTPFLGTKPLTPQDIELFESKKPSEGMAFLETLIREKFLRNMFKDEKPLLEFSPLRQQGDKLSVVYIATGDRLIKKYCDTFYEAGISLSAIDIFPFSILRGLAGSGVLDAMLLKIGIDKVWGCFGICGSQTWCVISQGPGLIGAGSFTTPGSKKSWEERITEFTESLGVGNPCLWLAWYEPGMQLPAEPLKLSLNAPIRPAMPGPFYASSSLSSRGDIVYTSDVLLLPALGSAFKQKIRFPLNWDLLSDPTTLEFKGKYSVTPYASYQPILPALLFKISLLSFALISLATLFLWSWNSSFDFEKGIRHAKIQSFLIENARLNSIYPELFSVINLKTPAGIQLESLKIVTPNQLVISGNANDRTIVNQFISMLLTSKSAENIKIQEKNRSINQLPGKYSLFHFEFTAEIEGVKSKLR